MAYSGQQRIAFDAGFNDALFGRPRDNPYDPRVVGSSFAAYEDGFERGLISEQPPRGPRGEQGDKGDTGDPGPRGQDGVDGEDGTSVLTGNGAPGAGLGEDGDVYIDAESGDIYRKEMGTWNLIGSPGGVAQTTRTDVVDPDAVPTVTYRGDATPGTATSASAWRIQRLTQQSDGDTEVLFADGNDNFDNIWDNRLSLSYS